MRPQTINFRNALCFSALFCFVLLLRAQIDYPVTTAQMLGDGVMGISTVELGSNNWVKAEPYSLVERMTIVRTLADGTTITTAQHERQMRDSDGRVRTETGHLKDGELIVDGVSIRDPAAHTNTLLDLKQKTARIRRLPEMRVMTAEEEARTEKSREEAVVRRADRNQSEPVTVETLTPKQIDGVYVDGKRTTRIIPPGRQGNDREIKIVFEAWRSPELRILLHYWLQDPIRGNQTIEITDLQRAEPDPTLFQIPTDFKVYDQRIAQSTSTTSTP
jgi:hypothetical protein